jgi:hypothetical protein
MRAARTWQSKCSPSSPSKKLKTLSGPWPRKPSAKTSCSSSATAARPPPWCRQARIPAHLTCSRTSPRWKGTSSAHAHGTEVEERRIPGRRIACSFPGCPRTYKRKGDCTRHFNNTHVQPLAFVCVYRCGRAFHRKDNMRAHVLSKHEKPAVMVAVAAVTSPEG